MPASLNGHSCLHVRVSVSDARSLSHIHVYTCTSIDKYDIGQILTEATSPQRFECRRRQALGVVSLHRLCSMILIGDSSKC
jgi:hypothetical protein